MRVFGQLILIAFIVLPAAAFGRYGDHNSYTPPMFTQSWGHAFRWNDHNRYHYGPQELSPMMISGGCLLAASHGGTVVCLDERHGFKRWQLKTKHTMTTGVVAHDGYGYAASQNGVLIKFGIHTGHIFWEENLRKAIIAPMMVRGNALYILSSDAQLWKYNLDTREFVWKYEDEIFQKVSLLGGTRPVYVAKNDIVVIGVPNGNVVAVDNKTGERAWIVSLPVREAIDDVDATALMLNDSRMVVSTSFSSTQVIDHTGRVIVSWPKGSPRGGVALPHLEKEMPVFIQPDVGEIRRVDLRNGHILKTVTVPVDWGYPQAPLMLGDRHCLVAYSEGPAVVYDTDTLDYTYMVRHAVGFYCPAACRE